MMLQGDGQVRSAEGRQRTFTDEMEEIGYKWVFLGISGSVRRQAFGNDTLHILVSMEISGVSPGHGGIQAPVRPCDEPFAVL